MSEVVVLGANKADPPNMGREIADYLDDRSWEVWTHDCLFDNGYQVPTWERFYTQMDALVVTLGRTMVQPFHEADDQALEDVIRACLTLPMLAAQQYIMQRQGRGGRVVFIGSYAFDHPITNGAAYCAAKAGLDMLARTLAWDYSSEGYSFFTVHPYHVPGTPMWEYVQRRVCETRGWTRQQADDYAMQNLKQPNPLSPVEIAEVVQWLLESPAAAWLSGAGLPLYGGTR